ncbi:hypothetical protein QJ048_06935 [Pinibacter sp. MAH-24]|uniref:Uncharacterized protein n=1 Tax=Pinibacter soli TaxID=3044211 RepID=A0ABT6RAK9_9BACT|nr:hypothetical protein [Pinibacter soli]MDI3319501.1 hypothetical protein [Pinibacter soli]
MWEFRTLYQGLQYRLLAFWDKTDMSIHLLYRHMDLSRNRVKCQRMKSQKRKCSEKNIFGTK